MYVVVAGCGRVGSQLATELAHLGHDVVIIDKSRDSFKRLPPTFNGMMLEGLGFDEETLKEAGIERADCFAAVTDLDNANLMAAQVVSKLFDVPVVIARLYNPDKVETFNRLGVNFVCGTTMLASEILARMVHHKVDHICQLRTGDADLVQFDLPTHLNGIPVGDLERKVSVRIALVMRKGETFVPDRETELYGGDEIVAGVVKRQREKLDELLGE